jgi:hypothetical protein
VFESMYSLTNKLCFPFSFSGNYQHPTQFSIYEINACISEDIYILLVRAGSLLPCHVAVIKPYLYGYVDIMI